MKSFYLRIGYFHKYIPTQLSNLFTNFQHFKHEPHQRDIQEIWRIKSIQPPINPSKVIPVSSLSPSLTTTVPIQPFYLHTFSFFHGPSIPKSLTLRNKPQNVSTDEESYHLLHSHLLPPRLPLLIPNEHQSNHLSMIPTYTMDESVSNHMLKEIGLLISISHVRTYFLLLLYPSRFSTSRERERKREKDWPDDVGWLKWRYRMKSKRWSRRSSKTIYHPLSILLPPTLGIPSSTLRVRPS